jgi:acetyl-CoA synthetase
VLGERVKIQNPLDYHTYIWGDRPALTACFTALLGTHADAHLLVLDVPRQDRCDVGAWDTAVAAFTDAQRATGARACVVSSMPEGMPEALGQQLVDAGIAPMQGISDCLEAVAAAGLIGAAQVSVGHHLPDPVPPAPVSGPTQQLDEAQAKEALAAFGVPTPRGEVAAAGRVTEAATRIGFPVVVKVLSADIVHKTQLGAVRVGLRSEGEVARAVADLSALGDRFLVEPMVPGTVAELLVGIQRHPRLGFSMTLGAGGALVELLDDTVTLLLPATPEEIRLALGGLRIWPVLEGRHCGRRADLDSVVRAVEAMVAFAAGHADRLVELEVNPLLALPQGAVAVDAVVRWAAPPGPPSGAGLVVEGARA